MLKKLLIVALLFMWLWVFAPRVQAFQEADGFDYPIGDKYRYTKEKDNVDEWYDKNHYQSILNGCFHSGDDWNKKPAPDGEVGEPVKAIGYGQVVKVRKTTNYADGIAIKHNYKGRVYFSIYWHVRASVVEGQEVNRGDIIATIAEKVPGVTAPHLHLEMRDQFDDGLSYPHDGSPATCIPGYYVSIDDMDKDHLIDPTKFIDEHRVATWHPNGSLLRDVSTKNLYRVEERKKRLILASYPYFLEKNVITVSPQELYCYADGADYNGSPTQGWEGYPEGSLIQKSGDSKVYVVSEGKLRWLDVTAKEFTSLGYQWESVETVYSCFNFGEPLKFWQFHNQSCQNSSVSLTISPNLVGGFQDSSGNPSPPPDQVLAGNNMFFVARDYD